jgi:hypothetical protein
MNSARLLTPKDFGIVTIAMIVVLMHMVNKRSQAARVKHA